VVYDVLFKAAAETLTTIAADPKHLGARIGLIAVLHTWGSTLTRRHPTSPVAGAFSTRIRAIKPDTRSAPTESTHANRDRRS
jgi:hypothetical protein